MTGKGTESEHDALGLQLQETAPQRVRREREILAHGWERRLRSATPVPCGARRDVWCPVRKLGPGPAPDSSMTDTAANANATDTEQTPRWVSA